MPVNEQDVLDRLDRIEARMRAVGLHDPDCPALERMQAQLHTGAYLMPVPCTCWLANPGPGGPGEGEGEEAGAQMPPPGPDQGAP